MPSIFPTSVTYEVTRGSPSSVTATSRLPTQVPPKDPHDKNCPYPSSKPGLILSTALHAMLNTSTSVPCIVPIYVTHKTPILSPSPGTTPSRLTSLAPSKEPPDTNNPDPLSPPSMLLTATTAKS